MKFIKNHLMFILPLMAILFGLEFYLVFDRTTKSYEKGLTEKYSMLVVANKPVDISDLKILNRHISSISEIKRKNILTEISKDLNEKSTNQIMQALPYFYNIGLDEYLHTSELDTIKKNLESDENIKKVETFGSAYSSSYRLFSFIKFTLKIFISFMGLISLFLIIKQMEVWKYAHKERMRIMEIFGASLFLRSGVLFKIAIIDAFVATLLTSLGFLFVKYQWAINSGIDMMIENKDVLFQLSDMAILLIFSLFIVIVAVYFVVIGSQKEED